MKNILIISDTHNFLDPKLIKYIEQADEVWHGGDIGTYELCKQIEKTCGERSRTIKPLKAVWGNIDGTDLRKTYQEHLIFNCEDIKVYITHIAGPVGKYNPKVREIMLQEKPDLFICGHSHILKVMFDKTYNVLYLNPGACGVHGFHKVKTAVRLEIEGKEMKNLEVIELGSRV
jgi:putative phosphoesterase